MTYKGFILGDPMGPDARQGFLRVTRYVRNNLKVGIDGSYTEAGVNLGRCISWEFTAVADVRYDINSALTATARYSWGNIQNFNEIPGNNQQANLLMMQLRYEY